MKVKDLMEELERCKKEYGDSFLDWDIYTEQMEEIQKKNKSWERFVSHDISGLDWEYFKCHGFWTKAPKDKIFTINVNY